MIILLLIYLLFQVLFDHWAQDSAIWWAVYYSFQYGWIAAIALYHFVKVNKLVYLFLSLPFIGLSIDEWIGYFIDSQPLEMASLPVVNLTIFTAALFIIYEIIQWKKGHSASVGRK